MSNTGPYVPGAVSPTSPVSVTVAPSAPRVVVGVTGPARKSSRIETKDIESAVFAHIQAMRALGRTRVNVTEIATALGLYERQVEATLSALRNKGVKVKNG